MGEADQERYGFTISALIRSYREMSELSQDGLAALSVELCEAGIIDKPIAQSAIARWERPERIEKLRQDSIDYLSVLLGYALQQSGFTGAKADDLKRHLSAANNRYADMRTVSLFALEMDALMQPWPRWMKDIIQHTIRQILIGSDAILRRYIAQWKAAEQIHDNQEE